MVIPANQAPARDGIWPVSQDDGSLRESLIPPEIAGDSFATYLTQLCQTEDLVNVLEIGSSSGAGSTAAIVEGLAKNPGQPRLFCLEMVRARYRALVERFSQNSFVTCYRASSVPPEGYVSEAEVASFMSDVDSDLRRYGLGTVLRWRAEELAYIRKHVDVTNGIDRIKSDFGIECFDLVLIDGSEFTGMEDFNRIRGARWILLDDINTLKTYFVWTLLKQDPDYELFFENHALRHGFAVFRRRATRKAVVNVHFFTIVLNGEPFIRYHAQEFSKLPFEWHWHIVEGVAELRHDSAWAAFNGGAIPPGTNRGGLSVDGTSEYIDELQRRQPDRISVYRKPFPYFWDGKIEMCNAVIDNLSEECLLWEVDVDEIWTESQIKAVRRAFLQEPERTAARYWCNFFVGPSRIISTRYNYAENPNQEWIRTWRFKPGMRWASHSPPVLAMKDGADAAIDVAKIYPFTQDEMEDHGAVFDHCAYTLESQVAFKDSYYGYAGALTQWKALQEDRDVPGFLGDHLAWVTDRTMFDDAERRFVAPVVAVDRESNEWKVRSQAVREQEVAELRVKAKDVLPLRVVIDGLCFQAGDPPVARIWASLLEGWLSSGFADNIILLDRGGTAPRFKGLTIRSIRPYAPSPFGDDHRFLQKVCDEEAATLFISTGPSFPIQTPSLHVAAEMPTSSSFGVGVKATRPELAITHASGLVAFSNAVADEMARRQTIISRQDIRVFQPVPLSLFQRPAARELEAFLKTKDITQPYVLYVGDRRGPLGDGNASLLFNAAARIPIKARPLLVCVDGHPELEPELAAIASETQVMVMSVSTAELPFLYAGATAFVNTAVRGSANITVLEAMACGCPVIATKNPTIEALVGDAATLVDWNDEDLLAPLILRLREPALRNSMVEAGLKRAAMFHSDKTAAELSETFIQAAENLKSGAISAPTPLWSDLITAERRAESELERNDKLNADNAELRAQHVLEDNKARTELENDLAATQHRLAQAAAEVALAAQARSEMDEALSRQTRDISRLDRIVAGLKNAIAEAEQKKENLSAEMEGMRAELQSRGMASASFAAERQALRADIARLERTLSDINLSRLWRLRRRVDELLRTFRLRRRPRADWEHSDSAS